MKQILRAFLFLLLFTATVNTAIADEKANVTKQGTVRGRIIDATKQTLPGASIYIEKLHTGVTSDVNGFYTFSNLDPGTYTVKVSYVGYSPVELKITIPAGRTLEKDVVLNEGVELQEVVVGGAFQGQRRAINSQKNNMGITNVVSADQVGKFPDSNIGDALKRISGINVQYDQGEARFGQVRGTSADLSSVTINGNRVPSAEGDTRNVQLDLIPADMIQTIEVNKVVTADMDGDAIGGSINLVTKNSPYKRTIAATAGTGYNWVSEKAQLNLGFTYGDRFFNDKLGLIVSASYQNSPSGSYDTEFVWEQDDNGKTYVNDYQIRQYYVTRERQSYSAALDWDINANHKLTFKGIFNNRNDWENRYRTTLKDLDPDGNATVRIQTKAGTPDNRNARLERQRTMDFALGGEHLFGALSMDWHASYAKASEERPNERYIDFQLKKQKFDMDLSDERQPFASSKTGSTMTLNDEFSLKELTEQQEDIKEQDLKFSTNFKLPFKNGNKLKFGAKVVRKTKDKEVDFYEYSPLDEDAFMTNSLANTVDQTNKNFMPNNKYQAGIYSFIAPALKCVGFYGTYTYTHSRVEDFNFEGRENEKDLSMPGSPEHTANASLYFEKGGLNLRLSYNFASDFIDEMGESTFYDRYYDKVNYMDVNASYTFGKKFKTTFYAEANNLLNQPLRYYQGTKDRTMQAEYYGVKVNAGVKINF